MIAKRQYIRQNIASQLEKTWNTLRILRSDLMIIWLVGQQIFAERLDQVILMGIIIISISNKIVLLSKPMGHDEAYTIMAFAIRPFRFLIADYHLPNNHVFHTMIIVKSK